MPIRTTAPLRQLLAEALPERPFEVAFWDGSRLPATNGAGGPTFTATGPNALAHLLRAPGQLGLGRAYADGSLTVDDIDLVMGLLNGWNPPPIDNATKAKLALAAVRATGRAPAQAPDGRARPARQAPLARARRARRAPPLRRLQRLLPPLPRPIDDVLVRGLLPRRDDAEEAQDAKLEMVCTKLGLQAGQRVLDVGCGWGSFALHAAERHGVHVTGITLSPPQAELAKQRAADAGLSDKIDIRIMDYRDLGAETFDAVSSIGMVEHVGDAQIDPYAATLASVLEPGGRLLNHGIARLRHTDPEAGDFSERFVFPDAAPLHLSRVLFALERAGFETEHTEGLRLDYAETLRHWAKNFDEHIDEAIALGGAERARVWRLYLRAARHGFESGFTSIYQALVTRR